MLIFITNFNANFKKNMMKKRFKNLLIIFSAVLSLQCSEEGVILSSDSEIDATDVQVIDTSVPVLDTRKKLSNIDLNNFIQTHQSFRLQVNDTISVLFKDIVIPYEDDSEADIVYSYFNNKAFVTFSNDGVMSFIANSETYTLQGCIYKNISVKEKEHQRLLAKKANADEDKVNRIILEDQDSSVLIEYLPKVDISKLYEENNGELPSDNGKKPRNSSKVVKEKINTTQNKNRHVTFVNIVVYHYKKTLSTTDVNYAKIHARKSLTSVFGNDLNSAKIKTYFNRSTKSKYRVNFDRPGELYYDWISYCRSTGKTRSGYKYLLLTEDGHDDDDDGEDVDGVAGMGGKYAWAEVDAKQHTTAGHEIGHNFNAEHIHRFGMIGL